MRSFLFYDLETTGRDPKWHRIMQFAAVRTDLELNPVAEPISWNVRLDDDVVPEPEACLVTGLTPQQVAQGIDEGELFRRLQSLFLEPGTCVAGYNNLRFDDEFLRYGFWRNLQDPYAREWQHGNSRWDLMDLVRMTAALRPQGLRWPEHADGRPSFRLEDLAAANGIVQERAHDACSDVLATVGLARALREAQPRLFDYYLGLRSKARVAEVVGAPLEQALVHVSTRYGIEHGRTAVVAPVARHPVNRNAVIVADLGADLSALADASPQWLAAALFTPAAERGDLPRLPLHEIQLNKVPAVAPLGVLQEVDQERLGLDVEAALQNLEWLREVPDLQTRVAQAYGERPPLVDDDVDASLYQGFLPNDDRRLLAELADDPKPSGVLPPMADGRARELAWRFLARRHPETLPAAQREQWRAHVRQLLLEGRGRHMSSLPQALARIAELEAEHDGPSAQAVLGSLRAHLEALARDYQCPLDAHPAGA